MENTNDRNSLNSTNDGENQGHIWMRHPNNESQQMAPDREEELEKEEEENESADWGDVDPQHDPMQPQGPMDPSGPGSAV